MEPDLHISLVGIPLEDAEMLRAALNSAYHHCTVLDLSEQYRKLSARPTQSNLTKSLQSALALLSAHIEETLAQQDPDGRQDQTDPE